jgi:TonB family protein
MRVLEFLTLGLRIARAKRGLWTGMSDETTQRGEQVPTTIGRFQITGPLGFGAMGAVYKAFDPMIKRTLAIKTIRLDVPRGSPQHKAFIERFYQEARISGTLSHPGIVTLFDIGEEGGVPFLAMEFIDGKTIAAVIEQGTRFKPEKVIGLVSQVAAALDYAHSRGVVHRDIKPSNLMLFDADKVKVTDFGIAKLADAEITHAGALLGTPSYMSPEQAMGEKLDGRSDIFSLGVCAFEMLSGQQPFPGANVTSILYKLVHVEPVEPADLEANGLVPQKWREVFHKVLAKKPANRYQTASAFVRDLEYCLGSWFTGLGEETISLAAAAPTEADEPTVTMRMPVPAALASPLPAIPQPLPASEPGAEALASVPDPGAADEAGATIVMKAGNLPEPATVLLAPASPLEDLVPATVRIPVPQPLPESTIVMPPPLPSPTTDREDVPEDTLRQAAAATATGALPAAVPVRGRPGVPVALVLGVAALVLLAAAGLLGWALLQRAPAVPPQPVPEASLAPTPLAVPSVAATAAPSLGSVHVESEPAGAVVKLNGEARGRTPLDLGDLAFGDYEVRVEQKGYEPQSQRVSLAAATPAAQLQLTLVRATPTSGSADVVSTPPGAAVAVDGRPTGRATPLNGLGLRAGSRRLELTLEGYEPWTGTVDVTAGQKGRVEVKLRPLAKARTTPTTTLAPAVDTARVYAESEVDSRPKKVSGNSAEYPRDRAPRLRSGERISVTVQFLVTETGEVQDVKVTESGGKMVDEAVVNAIRSWRFQPATKHGTPVKSLTAFRQTFLGG